MNNGWHGKPLSVKQQVRLMIALTILAWATQTLFHQWGFGQEFSPEKFLSSDARTARSATLEIRNEATVYGTDIKLKQICRWSDSDATGMAPLADLVIVRFGNSSPFLSITAAEIKAVLSDANVNMAMIQFAGATACTVNRGDVQVDEKSALQKWIEAKESTTATTQPAESPAPAAPVSTAKVDTNAGTNSLEDHPVQTLRDLITNDLAQKLNLSPQELQISFNPQDARVLNLSEPMFRFNLDPRRARNLGQIQYDVLIVTDSGTQKASITAIAKAWQEQIVVSKQLAVKQVIRDEDVIDRRTLIDHLFEDPTLTRAQVVGQQAARDLRAGTVVTSRLVDPVQLVKAGQFVTITLQRGNVQVNTVARALEAGSFGQTIKVKNESTRDVFEIVIDGPQSGSVGPMQPPQQTALR